MSLPDPGNVHSTKNWEYVEAYLQNNPQTLPSDIHEFLKPAGFKLLSDDFQKSQQKCCALAFQVADKALQEYICSEKSVEFPDYCIALFDFAYQIYDLYDNGMEQETILINDKTEAAFNAFLATAKSRLYSAIHKLQNGTALPPSTWYTVKSELEVCYPILDRLQFLLKINAIDTGLIPITATGKDQKNPEWLYFYTQYIKNNPKLDQWSSKADNVLHIKSKDVAMMIELLKLQAKCCMVLGIANPLKYLNAALYLCAPDDDLLRSALLNDYGNTAIWFATSKVLAVTKNKSVKRSLDNINDFIVLAQNLLSHQYGAMAQTVIQSSVTVETKNITATAILKEVDDLIILARDALIHAYQFAIKSNALNPREANLNASLAKQSLHSIATHKDCVNYPAMQLVLAPKPSMPQFDLVVGMMATIYEEDAEEQKQDLDPATARRKSAMKNAV